MCVQHFILSYVQFRSAQNTAYEYYKVLFRSNISYTYITKLY